MGAIKHNYVHSIETLTAGKGRGWLLKSACSSVAWPGPSIGVCPSLGADSPERFSPSRGGLQTQLYVNSPVSCSPKFLFSVKVKN